LASGSKNYHPKDLIDVRNRIDFFGDHVAFDKKKWLNKAS
jgi:hypothetical protein